MTRSVFFIRLYRTLRPYTKLLIALTWFYLRFIDYNAHYRQLLLQNGTEGFPFSRNYTITDFEIIEMDTNATTSHCEHIQAENDFSRLQTSPRGLLDHLHDAISDSVSTLIALIAQQTESLAVHRFAENSCLFLNDFLGILLISAVVRFIRKLQCWSWVEMKDMGVEAMFAFAKENIPVVRRGLKKEEEKMESSLKASMWKDRKIVTRVLPIDGTNMTSLLKVSCCCS